MTTTNLIDSQPTGASVRRDAVGRSESDTRTRTISDYVDDSGYFRNTTKIIEDDMRNLRMIVDEHHSGALQAELSNETNKCAKESLESLLDRLSELGFSWRHIAQIVGVPVSVLRKWRTGGATTGAQHRRVAELLAVCDIASTRYHISDVASWFETPMHSEVPVTCIDMASEDRFDLILQFMCDQGAETVLDEFEPGWRDSYKSSVEVFTGPDGLPGLRLTGDLI